MRIKQVMTSPVICAGVPGNRTDVLHLMIKHHVSGVPVVREGTQVPLVDAGGKLTGMIYCHDLLKVLQTA